MAAPAALGTIVFSHANSFPAGTYRLIFEAWRAAGYAVQALEKYGHDPRYPVTNHWPRLRDQLIDFAQAHVDSGPLYLVGHSLGGFLSVLAAAKRPDLARGVVMLDSPIISGLLTQTIRFVKATGLGARISPGHVSQRRRQHWPNAQSALTHFQAKPAFARWHPQMLRDYIDSGIAPAQAPQLGHTLVFHREVETAIYNTLPHDIPAFLRTHPLHCPLAFIGGTQSAEVKQIGMATTERLTEGRMSWIDGTHLFPFEQPELTAAEVLRWLKDDAYTRPANEAGLPGAYNRALPPQHL